MFNLPDFLIIGSMKCGTTVLYEFINSHKKVKSAIKKEIHYFSLYQYKGIDWYKKHFESKEDCISGEASPTYFDIAFSPFIPRSIKEVIPNVKLILIVRDPIERAVSHYLHFCKINKIEALIKMDINDFFNQSFADTLKQTTNIDIYLNQILSFSAYYRKFKTYLNVFPRNQLLVLSNNELKNEPIVTMKKVFKFLDLEPIESDHFKKIKYSMGSNIEILSEQNLYKLKNYLYPDYKLFCEFTEIQP